jgi:hypothetical protein
MEDPNDPHPIYAIPTSSRPDTNSGGGSLQRRWRHWRAIKERWPVKVIGFGFAFLTLLAFLRDEFSKGTWHYGDLLRMVPWSPWVWATVGFALFSYAIFESSLHVKDKAVGEIRQKLTDDLVTANRTYEQAANEAARTSSMEISNLRSQLETSKEQLRILRDRQASIDADRPRMIVWFALTRLTDQSHYEDDQFMFIRNIGKRTALDILVQPIEFNHVTITFGAITRAMLHEDSEPLRFTLNRGGQNTRGTKEDFVQIVETYKLNALGPIRVPISIIFKDAGDDRIRTDTVTIECDPEGMAIRAIQS